MNSKCFVILHFDITFIGFQLTDNSHVGSYLQEEAAFINSGTQWKALFPGFRVRGCVADDMLPGGLGLLVSYLKKKKKKQED